MILNYVTQVIMITVPVFFVLLGIGGIAEFLKNKRGEGVVVTVIEGVAVVAIALLFAFTMTMTAMAFTMTMTAMKNYAEDDSLTADDYDDLYDTLMQLGIENIKIETEE